MPDKNNTGKPQPLFLLANGRSGTHLLRGMLAAGFGVEDFGEAFNPDLEPATHDYFPFLVDRVKQNPQLAVPAIETQQQLFAGYLDRLAAISTGRYFLLDAKYSHSHRFNPVHHDVANIPFMLAMIRDRAIPTIHLVRRNLVARRLSFLRAVHTGQWIARKPAGRAQSGAGMNVDCNRFLADLNRDLAEVRFFDNCMKGHPRLLAVYYKELLDGGEMSASVRTRLSGFLGCNDPGRIEPRTFASGEGPDEYVENHAELAARLAGTPFAEMLAQVM